MAYPVVDGVPILVIPEQDRRASEAFDVDLTQPRYAEAYEEIEFYNEVAAKEAEDIRRSESYTALEPALRPGVADGAFPEPRDAWLDAVPNCKSQFLGYRHLGRPESRRLLQVGGKGLHAVKWLVAGGAEAWVLTPMLGEALCSMALAVSSLAKTSASALLKGRRVSAASAIVQRLPLTIARLSDVMAMPYWFQYSIRNPYLWSSSCSKPGAAAP